MSLFGQFFESSQKEEPPHLNKDFIIQKLSAILDTLSSSVFATEPDGIVFYWGKSMEIITGIKKEEALGKNYSQLIKLGSPKNKKTINTPLFEILENRERIQAEYELALEKKQNATIPVLAVFTPLLNENNKLIGVLAEIHDISQEKRLEEMKLDFVSIVSHELRTPIASIKGYLDVVLQEAGYLTQEHREFLKRAYFSNERELETIEALLNVSRIEQGTIKTSIQPVRIEDIISGVVAEWGGAAFGKGLELKFTYPHFTLPSVLADRDRLHEILTNLVSNAIKYTHQGTITISVSQKDKDLITAVADTGPGIPEEVKPHIFQRFYRGERSLTEETPGTGLGLYITHAFMDLMGGKIWFDSKIDRGTIFYLSLPITQ